MRTLPPSAASALVSEVVPRVLDMAGSATEAGYSAIHNSNVSPSRWTEKSFPVRRYPEERQSAEHGLRLSSVGQQLLPQRQAPVIRQGQSAARVAAGRLASQAGDWLPQADAGIGASSHGESWLAVLAVHDEALSRTAEAALLAAVRAQGGGRARPVTRSALCSPQSGLRL